MKTYVHSKDLYTNIHTRFLNLDTLDKRKMKKIVLKKAALKYKWKVSEEWMQKRKIILAVKGIKGQESCEYGGKSK